MEDLIPLLAIFCIFGLPVIAFIVIRAMQHQERIEMIRRGVMPPSPRAPQTAPIEQDDPQRSLRKGIVLSFVGFAITIGLSFIGYDAGPPSSFHPGPWLLGGLIPMFVGVAQVVTALLFGATLPRGMSGAHYTLGPGQTPSPPPPPTFEGAYTYRPDPNTQELEGPSPPDRR